jgi:hypothetical protein
MEQTFQGPPHWLWGAGEGPGDPLSAACHGKIGKHTHDKESELSHLSTFTVAGLFVPQHTLQNQKREEREKLPREFPLLKLSSAPGSTVPEHLSLTLKLTA